MWSCLSYHRPSVGSCGGREGLGVAGITGTPIMGGGGEGEGEGGTGFALILPVHLS